MSFDSNSGSVYYELSCGVPSDVGVDIDSNVFTGYYHLSANDFILWGQSTHYVHISSNKGSSPYYLECDVPSDAGLNLQSNAGTHYYYNSAFNCVSFCDPVYRNLQDVMYILLLNGDVLYYDGNLLTWTPVV